MKLDRVKQLLLRDRVAYLLIAAMILAFALLRFYRIKGQQATFWVDSVGYMKLDFSGRSARLWPVPAVFEIIESDYKRMIFQAVFATIAWGFTAVVVAYYARKFTITAAFTVLLLGSTDQISLWDKNLLSESIGTSLIVMTMGAMLWVIHERSTVSVSVLAIVGTLTAMTRPPQIPMLVVLLVVTVWFAVRDRSWKYGLIALALLPMVMWGVEMVRNNRATSELNFYMMLDERIMHNDARREWFVDHGMPVNDAIKDATGFGEAADITADLYEYMPLPEGQPPNAIMIAGGVDFAKWVRHHGWSTYAKFLATHPNDAIKIATDQNYFTLNPGPKDLLPSDAVMIMPDWIFGGWQWFAFPAVTLAGVLAFFHRLDRVMIKIMVGASLCVPWFFFVVHTAGMEHPRHALGVSVTVRLLGLAFILYAVERLVELRGATEESNVAV